MNKKTIQNIRKRLYEDSPLCRNCGNFTIYPDSEDNGASKPNTATIQHINPRYHPQYDKDLELWCYKCNEEDAATKNKFKIFSREEMLYEVLCQITGKYGQLSGTYIVDGRVLTYHKHKLIKERDIISFKFEILEKWLNSFIDNLPDKKTKPFESFYKNSYKGEFIFKQHSIGGGWYQRQFYQTELEKYLKDKK